MPCVSCPSGQWAFPAMWSLAPPHHLPKSLPLSIRAIQLQCCRQSRWLRRKWGRCRNGLFFLNLFFFTALLERRQVTVHTSYVRSIILSHFGQQAFKSWCFFVFVIKEFKFPKCCRARFWGLSVHRSHKIVNIRAFVEKRGSNKYFQCHNACVWILGILIFFTGSAPKGLWESLLLLSQRPQLISRCPLIKEKERKLDMMRSDPE